MADPAPSNSPDAAPPPRKRRFVQIHLSTSIVLMFLAGGLIWANIFECVVGPPFLPFAVNGFPLRLVSTTKVLFDLFFAVVLLAATAIACEKFTSGRWRLWHAFVLIEAVLWFPLGVFLADLAGWYVTSQNQKHIFQGWPSTEIAWEWDGERWLDFPSFHGAIVNLVVVILLIGACLAALAAIVFVAEYFVRRRGRKA